MRLTVMSYERKQAYKTIEEAFQAFKEAENNRYNPNYISLGVGCDKNGRYWFAVDHANVFTNCTENDLTNWIVWYDVDQIEEEE